MRNIRVEKEVRASRDEVWTVLADFPNIADWNSGVTTSYATGEHTGGVGATRHCDLAPMGALEETVTGWAPGERLVVSIDSAARVPIDHGEVTFDLSDATDGTRVTVSYDYAPKYGVVGRLMGGVIDRRLRSGFGGFLDELEAAALTR